MYKGIDLAYRIIFTFLSLCLFTGIYFMFAHSDMAWYMKLIAYSVTTMIVVTVIGIFIWDIG